MPCLCALFFFFKATYGGKKQQQQQLKLTRDQEAADQSREIPRAG